MNGLPGGRVAGRTGYRAAGFPDGRVAGCRDPYGLQCSERTGGRVRRDGL